MSREAELEHLPERIDALIAQGCYSEVRSTIREYCRILRDAAEALPRGDPRLNRLEENWRRLYNETLRRLRARRAQAEMRVARLHHSPYAQPASCPHTWECRV